MYPFVNKDEIPPPAFEFPDVPGYLRERVPTFERALDQYFDGHFEAIIEEWELLRTDDLRVLERRIATVTSDIDLLCRNRDAIRERVNSLDATLSQLEGSR
jgi:hypothetical protein